MPSTHFVAPPPSAENPPPGRQKTHEGHGAEDRPDDRIRVTSDVHDQKFREPQGPCQNASDERADQSDGHRNEAAAEAAARDGLTDSADDPGDPQQRQELHETHRRAPSRWTQRCSGRLRCEYAPRHRKSVPSIQARSRARTSGAGRSAMSGFLLLTSRLPFLRRVLRSYTTTAGAEAEEAGQRFGLGSARQDMNSPISVWSSSSLDAVARRWSTMISRRRSFRRWIAVLAAPTVSPVLSEMF